MHQFRDPEGLLEDLEADIMAHINETFFKRTAGGLGKANYRKVFSGVRALSDAFTRQRSSINANYLDRPEGRSAYLAYFHLANAIRLVPVFREIFERGLLAKEKLSVLDVGAASFSVLWAMSLAQLPENDTCCVDTYVALDRSKKILGDGEALFRRSFGKRWASLPRIERRAVDLFDLSPTDRAFKKTDLVVASQVFNELGDPRDERSKRRILQWVTSWIAQGKSVLIVEPALKDVSRGLMRLRDAVVAKQGVDVSMPCLHQAACPLLNEPRDWCHFEVRWTPPPLRRRLETDLRHGSGSMKWSHLFLQPSLEQPTDRETGSVEQVPYRVIGHPLSGKHETVLAVCQPDQKLVLHVSKKEKDLLRVVKRVRRGDMIRMKTLPMKKQISSYGEDRQLCELDHLA